MSQTASETPAVSENAGSAGTGGMSETVGFVEIAKAAGNSGGISRGPGDKAGDNIGSETGDKTGGAGSTRKTGGNAASGPSAELSAKRAACTGRKDNRYRIVALVAVCMAAVDQLTKLLVVASLAEYDSVPVVHGFFNLVNVRNRGAAFGFLNSPDIEWQFWLFLAATAVAVWAIWRLARDAAYDVRLFVGLGGVLGGAVGNLIDRVRLRAVIDFMDVYVGSWHWPAFNVADAAICIGAGLVVLSMWKPR